MKKFIGISVALLATLSLAACGNSSPDKSSESKSNSESISKRDSSIKKKLDSAKSSKKKSDAAAARTLKKLNASIAARLKENQGFTDNPAFDYSRTIASIKLDSDYHVHVTANGKFAALNDTARIEVAQKSMNICLSVMDENGSATDEQLSEGLPTDVKYGGDYKVQSHATNYKKFHLY